MERERKRNLEVEKSKDRVQSKSGDCRRQQRADGSWDEAAVAVRDVSRQVDDESDGMG